VCECVSVCEREACPFSYIAYEQSEVQVVYRTCRKCLWLFAQSWAASRTHQLRGAQRGIPSLHISRKPLDLLMYEYSNQQHGMAWLYFVEHTKHSAQGTHLVESPSRRVAALEMQCDAIAGLAPRLSHACKYPILTQNTLHLLLLGSSS
jgi:hypothetical protein